MSCYLWRTRSAQIRGGSVAQIMASAAQICGAHGFCDFPLQLTSLWVIVHICSPDFGHCHSLSQNHRRGWRSPQVVKAVVWIAYYPGCWCLASSIRRFQYLHGARIAQIALFTWHNLLSVALSVITVIITLSWPHHRCWVFQVPGMSSLIWWAQVQI